MEGVIFIAVMGGTLVAFRMYFMGNKPPEFAPSDNPASDADSIVTRTLTYFLLPALNFWLLLCPRVLSFDWSMNAIPLVESVTDYRNVFSVVFYSSIVYLAYLTLSYIHAQTDIEKPHMNGNGNGHSTHVLYNNSKHSSVKYRPLQRQSSVPGENTHVSNSTNSHSSVYLVSLSPHSIDVLIFSIAILVFPFILATNLFFYVGFVIAERVLYIPSMGFCLLAAHGFYVLYKQYESNKNMQKLVAIALTVLIVMNGGQTVIRNRDWSTEEKLYESGVAVNPPKGLLRSLILSGTFKALTHVHLSLGLPSNPLSWKIFTLQCRYNIKTLIAN